MSGPSAAEPQAAILVVDESETVAGALKAELSRDGNHVATATSAAEALRAMREIRFEVVIVNRELQGIGGEDTLSGLRAIDPDVEVIVGTALPTVDSAVDCMRRGAFDYVTKPYDAGALRRGVRRALERSPLQGMMELHEAARALTSRGADLPRRIPEMAAPLLRADAAALVLEPAGEPQLHAREGTGLPSRAFVLELSRRALETPAPFRIVSPRGEGVPTTPGDDEFAVALLCPLRAGRETEEGALVLLRRQGSPPFTVAVVRRATTFGALAALALATARVGAEKELGRPSKDALTRLMREARQAVEVLGSEALSFEGSARLQRLATVVSALEKLLLG